MNLWSIYILSVFVQLLYPSTSQSSCTTYHCGSLNPASPPPAADTFICGEHKSESPKNYTFESCPQPSQICNLFDWVDKTSPLLCTSEPTPTGLAAGEPCYSPRECYTESCAPTGECWGHPFEGHCDSTFACAMGNYCNTYSGRCESMPLLGHNCGYNNACPKFALCIGGKCILKFSLLIGTVVPATSTGYYPVCLTGWAVKNSTMAVCAPGYKLQGYNSKIPVRAPLDSKICNYTDSTGNVVRQEYPDCGMSDSPLAFCRPGLGDITSKIEILQYYFSLKLQCNPGAGSFCLAAKRVEEKAWMAAYEAYGYMGRYENVVTTPACMQDLMQYKTYFQALNYGAGWPWWVYAAIVGGVLGVSGIAYLIYILIIAIV